jgi:hypothetical protein
MNSVDHTVERLLAKVYRGIGTPYAIEAHALVVKGEWAKLQELPQLDPSLYEQPHHFRLDYQAREFFRKVELPGDDAARAKRALDAFLFAERVNAQTNARLARFIHNGPFGPEDEPVIAFIERWRKICDRVLGQLPARLTPEFTPGATLSDQTPRITIPDKMSSQLTLYPETVSIWNHSVVGIDVLDQGHSALLVRSNRYFTVPKDSRIRRSCCIEASGAVMLQRAAGIAIRDRYWRAYNVDLREAQPLHVTRAQKASIDGSEATVDLTMASDSVSRNLVKLVLPDRWYSLLDALRAKSTQVDSYILYNEKFSSMGNGFTFELETLLFRTLLEALGCPHDSLVFGDDIIVPTAHATDVIAALRFFGFTPNPKKTFCEGPFRESCGGDFFLGCDVSPVRMKKLPDEPQHWVVLANQLRRADPEFLWSKAAWRFCIDQLPHDWRLYGPDWLGDMVLYDPGATPVMMNRKTYQGPGFFFKRPIPRTFPLERHFRPEVVLKSAVFGVDRDVSVRGLVSGFATDWIPSYGLGGEPFEALRKRLSRR